MIQAPLHVACPLCGRKRHRKTQIVSPFWGGDMNRMGMIPPWLSAGSVCFYDKKAKSVW